MGPAYRLWPQQRQETAKHRRWDFLMWEMAIMLVCRQIDGDNEMIQGGFMILQKEVTWLVN